MKIYRDRTRGRTRESWLFIGLFVAAVCAALAALSQVVANGGGWRVGWLAITVGWVLVVAVMLVRVRRRERAADAADPPRE